jgi:Fur family ferric uptake transcriptional regulator
MRTPALERCSLLQELSRRGVRITGQRKTIVEIIQESERHLDAATLLERARQRDPGVNRATVYRTIELLKKLRLIDELDAFER